MRVVVEIPDEFSRQILPAGQDPSRALLEEAALKAFCEDRVTAYELRQILGFETRYQLDGFLKERGIDHGAYGPEDLQHDVQTMDSVREKESQNSHS
jgi:predicted HTH domain antitoxin